MTDGQMALRWCAAGMVEACKQFRLPGLGTGDHREVGLGLATLSWVHWFNEQRLHSHCRDVPPAEFEAAFYAAAQTDQQMVGIQ